MKTIAMEKDYDALIKDQISEIVTYLVEHVKVVEEVNLYDSWDAKFEMNFMDNNDGLHEDLVSDVWYAKEDLYGTMIFILDAFHPTRLKEDESYT